MILMKNFYEDSMSAIRKYVEDQHDGKVNSASRALGLKDPSVLSHWLSGRRSPSLSVLGPVMDAIGVSVSMGDVPPADFAYIPKVAAVAGCGSSVETSGEIEGMYAFRKEFIFRHALHPRQCILLDVKGDSMEPILHDGDTVLVDKSDTMPQDGKIYLVSLGDELMVKHLYKTPRGLLLRSENSRYPDIPVEAADRDGCRIHGRVRWFGCIC